MKYAELGTVSRGTMGAEDLLETLSYELEALVHNNADAWCSEEGRAERDAYIALIWEAREVASEDYDGAYDVVDALFDALNDFAPQGTYFGAHPGDGSDYGFWEFEQDEEQDAN